MKVTVDTIYSTITEFPPVPWDKKLRKHFTVKSPDSFWQKKNNPFAGETQFISDKTDRIPTGLLHELDAWCKGEGITLNVTDNRKYPAPEIEQISEGFLGGSVEDRDYQIDAVNTALREKTGLIKCPTGGGKTEILIALIKALNKKTIILLERTNLATQTKQRFIKRGFKASDIGLVTDGTCELDRKITIGTVQSIWKLDPKQMEPFQVVICDEAHHSKARTYIKILKRLKNASYRFGLSGTLFTKDKEANYYRMAYLGKAIWELKTKTLVDSKVLSKPIIRVLEITKPNSSVLRSATSFNDAYVGGIVENHYRNSLIVKLANKLPGKTLVLFQRIDHGEVLRKYIPRCIYVDGKDNATMRDEKLKGFNASTSGIMVASTIFDEGIDIPGIHNLIIGSGGKSIIKVIQRLGRGLRQNDTGMVQVFDFLDLTNDYLERHSYERIDIYKSEEHTVKIIRITDSIPDAD